MFHNISNPKWFGNWSRLEDDYLDTCGIAHIKDGNGNVKA